MFFGCHSVWHTHDCFKCFNRLPKGRYSIFQYTDQERNKKLEKRYWGAGAVRNYQRLIKDAEDELNRERQMKENPMERRVTYVLS